jgi:hypothetical protein
VPKRRTVSMRLPGRQGPGVVAGCGVSRGDTPVMV